MKKLKYTFLFVLIYNVNSFACTCGHDYSIGVEDYNNADVIFVGTLINTEIFYDTLRNSYSDIIVYSAYKEFLFEIEEIYKGKHVEKWISIRSNPYGASCGLEIDIDEKWLIFAYKRNEILRSGLCVKNRQVTPSRELRKHEIELLDTLRNIIDGFHTFYDYRNEVEAEGKFFNRLPDSTWNYYLSGKLRIISNYKNGMKEGWETRFLPNDRMHKIMYRNKKVTERKEFDSTGNLQERSVMIRQNNRIVREDRYYPDGSIKSEIGNYPVNFVKSYYPNGKLRREEFRQDSVFVKKMYFKNGNLKSESLRKSKVIMEKEYSEDGTLIREDIIDRYKK